MWRTVWRGSPTVVNLKAVVHYCTSECVELLLTGPDPPRLQQPPRMFQALWHCWILRMGLGLHQSPRIHSILSKGEYDMNALHIQWGNLHCITLWSRECSIEEMSEVTIFFFCTLSNNKMQHFCCPVSGCHSDGCHFSSEILRWKRCHYTSITLLHFGTPELHEFPMKCCVCLAALHCPGSCSAFGVAHMLDLSNACIKLYA